MIINRRRTMGCIADDGYIHFADPEVVSVLTAKGIIQEGEGLTAEQAALVNATNTSRATGYFANNTTVVSFDEFKYFTRWNTVQSKQDYMFYKATNLVSTDLTNCTRITAYFCAYASSLIYFHGYGNLSNTLNLINLVRFDSTGSIYAFQNCSGLKYITSLGTAPFIPSYTFTSCENLETVNLPTVCTILYNSAFSGCPKLTTINISQIQKIEDSVFNGCSALEYCDGPNPTQGELNLPNLTGSLGKNAFRGCTKLTTITSLGTITTIGEYAFENCTLLANINIPASVEKVNKAAFAGTAWLNSQPNNSAIIINNKCLYSFKGSLGANYVVPSTVKYITENALYNVSGLEEITIPSSVTEVGRSCVGRNSSLTTINYESSVPIAKEFAQSCSNLTTLNITGSPTSIYEAAFKYCNLSSINIPASVTSIAFDAFFGNGSCTSISVNSNNTVFDSRDNCNAIIRTATNALIKGCKNTVIPNTVTSLNEYSFAGVTEMTSIDIPANVSALGGNVFRECSQLVSVTVRAINPPSAVNSIFQSCNSNLVINVPSGSVDAYKAASGWSTYAGRIQAIPI